MNTPLTVSGEWLLADDGTTYLEGYAVTAVYPWSGGVEFTCSPLVARAVVRDNALRWVESPFIDRLEWKGDTIVHASPTVPDYRCEYAPLPDGQYRLGFGWTWGLVDPARCADVVGRIVDIVIPQHGRYRGEWLERIIDPVDGLTYDVIEDADGRHWAYLPAWVDGCPTPTPSATPTN